VSRFDELLSLYADEEASTGEVAELEALLRSDPALRRTFFERSVLDVQLLKLHRGAMAAPAARRAPRFRRFRSDPAVRAGAVGLAAAAALLLAVLAALGPRERRRPPAPAPETAVAPSPDAPAPAPSPRPPAPEPVVVPAPPPILPPPPPPALPAEPGLRAPDAKPPSPAPPAPAPDRETVPAPRSVASVVEVEGRVLRARDALLPGDGLHTVGPSSRASLVFPDGTRVRLEGDAQVSAVDETPAGKRLRLERGEIEVAVRPQPTGRPFVLQTPQASVTVVGTSFRLRVEGGTSRVEVSEGRVRLARTADGRSADVAAGQYAICAAELSPRPLPTSPSLPPGAMLWLRADAGVTLAEDGAVERWGDAVAPGAPSRPRYVPAALGGHPAIRFDGRDDALVAELPVEGRRGLTLALVAACREDPTGGPVHGERAALFWDESARWGWVYLSPFQSTVKYRFGTLEPNNLPMWTRPAPLGPDFTVSVSVKDGPREFLYVNGALVAREATKEPALRGTLPALSIGRGAQGTGFPGDIAEILVYPRALAPDELRLLEGHLLRKYFVRR
jgi:ferric-dicitrate binding protein FerR (iron transport regulator)